MPDKTLNDQFRFYHASAHAWVCFETQEEELVYPTLSYTHEKEGSAVFVWDCGSEEFRPLTYAGKRTASADQMKGIWELFTKYIDPEQTPKLGKNKQPDYLNSPLRIAGLVDLLRFLIRLPLSKVAVKNDDESPQPLGPSVVYIKDGPLLLDTEDAQIVRLMKDLLVNNRNHKHTLVMCGADFGKVDRSELANLYVNMEVPLPSTTQLTAEVYRILQKNELQMDDDLIDNIAEAGRGMPMVKFSDAFAKSYIETDRTTVSPESIARERSRIINSTRGLQVLEERIRPQDYCGHERLIRDLRQYQAAYSHKGKEFGLQQPRGFLLVGPGGNGKTYTGGLIAQMYALQYIRLDLNVLQGRYVGDTAVHARTCLKTIDSIGKALVLSDEVEKQIGNVHNSTENHSKNDIIDELLYRMSCSLKDVLFVFTSNRPSTLPPEFVRRLDGVYYLGMPTMPQRMSILEVHCRKQDIDPSSVDIEVLANSSEGYSAYELEKAVKQSKFIAYAAAGKSLPKVLTSHVQSALHNINPIFRFNMADFVRIHLWARENAIMATDDVNEHAALDNMIQSLCKEAGVKMEELDPLPPIDPNEGRKL